MSGKPYENDFNTEAEERPTGVQDVDDDSGDEGKDAVDDTGKSQNNAEIARLFPLIWAKEQKVKELEERAQRMREVEISPLVRELRVAFARTGPYKINGRRHQIRNSKKGFWFLVTEKDQAMEDISIPMPGEPKAAE